MELTPSIEHCLKSILQDFIARMYCNLRACGRYKQRNDLQAYEALKASDPNFYRETDDLAYGSAPKPSEAAVERLVEDLINKKRKKGEFSRRRYAQISSPSSLEVPRSVPFTPCPHNPSSQDRQSLGRLMCQGWAAAWRWRGLPGDLLIMNHIKRWRSLIENYFTLQRAPRSRTDALKVTCLDFEAK